MKHLLSIGMMMMMMTIDDDNQFLTIFAVKFSIFVNCYNVNKTYQPELAFVEYFYDQN